MLSGGRSGVKARPWSRSAEWLEIVSLSHVAGIPSQKALAALQKILVSQEIPLSQVWTFLNLRKLRNISASYHQTARMPACGSILSPPGSTACLQLWDWKKLGLISSPGGTSYKRTHGDRGAHRKMEERQGQFMCNQSQSFEPAMPANGQLQSASLPGKSCAHHIMEEWEGKEGKRGRWESEPNPRGPHQAMRTRPCGSVPGLSIPHLLKRPGA